MLILLSGYSAHADMIGYRDSLRIQVVTKHYILIHFHDWSKNTHDARWKMISTDEDPFTSENSYAYIQCIDRKTGQTVFKRPSTALKQLYISPDEKYIVGISDIKLWNPFQLLVYAMDGTLIDKRAFGLLKNNGLKIPISESASNWVSWYYKPNPHLQFQYRRSRLVAISLLDLHRKRVSVPVRY